MNPWIDLLLRSVSFSIALSIAGHFAGRANAFFAERARAKTDELLERLGAAERKAKQMEVWRQEACVDLQKAHREIDTLRARLASGSGGEAS